jgi:hypothetical protein
VNDTRFTAAGSGNVRPRSLLWEIMAQGGGIEPSVSQNATRPLDMDGWVVSRVENVPQSKYVVVDRSHDDRFIAMSAAYPRTNPTIMRSEPRRAMPTILPSPCCKHSLPQRGAG